MKARKRKNEWARWSKKFARLWSDARGHHLAATFAVTERVEDERVASALDEAERHADAVHKAALQALGNDPDLDAWQFVEDVS